MSGRYYEGRYFTVYVTANGLMDKVNQHCQKYGLSYSKFAQMAIAEKMEREEQQQLGMRIEGEGKLQKGVRGPQATKQATPATPPTAPSSPEVVLATQHHHQTIALLSNDHGGLCLGE